MLGRCLVLRRKESHVRASGNGNLWRKKRRGGVSSVKIYQVPLEKRIHEKGTLWHDAKKKKGPQLDRGVTPEKRGRYKMREYAKI